MYSIQNECKPSLLSCRYHSDFNLTSVLKFLPFKFLTIFKTKGSVGQNFSCCCVGRIFFWDNFLKELRHQAQLGNQAFWWFVYSILTSPDWLKCDWMGTGKGTFLLLAREKTNGKLSINPIFFSFSRERILPYLAALRSNTNLLPLAKIRFLREF